MSIDVERLIDAMAEAYTYEDHDNGVPTLPFYDDFEAFWEPFAKAVVREYDRLTTEAAS